jgi:hypothetical protein
VLAPRTASAANAASATWASATITTTAVAEAASFRRSCGLLRVLFLGGLARLIAFAFLEERLVGETDFAARADVHDLHFGLLALAHFVAHVVDAVVRHLQYAQQAIAAGMISRSITTSCLQHQIRNRRTRHAGSNRTPEFGILDE